MSRKRKLRLAMNDRTDRLRAEVARRRTFAIISHPDAGKTTLTEKLLLYGGAVHLAGSVKQRRDARHGAVLEREGSGGVRARPTWPAIAFRLLDTIISSPPP